MPRVPVIALIDGEHHPDTVREALARLDLAGVVFCGGEEKLGPGPLEQHYGMAVETDPEEGLRRLAPRADTVVDLADEPVLPASRKLRMAALALSLGLAYEGPGGRLDPPRYEPVDFDGPAEPRLAGAAPSLDELIAIAEAGSHAASDYLEDAVIAGVRTVGCRRVGGGFAGAPYESNVPAGAALAASLEPGAIVFEGSGACTQPVEV